MTRSDAGQETPALDHCWTPPASILPSVWWYPYPVLIR